MARDDRPARPAHRAGHGAVTPAPEALDALRRHTDARIALGRAGTGLPTAALLRFSLDHARARDAVYSVLDTDNLAAGLAALDLPLARLRSRATDRAAYIRRPDLGRLVDPGDGAALSGLAADRDVLIALVDGLSATAVNINALPVVRALLPRLAAEGLSVAGAVMIEQGRVAAPDAVAERLGAGCTVVLIGERPGLSAADSLGAYLTWHAVPGTPDSRRNCISNIRDGGLAADDAAARIAWLAAEMKRRSVSGIALKAAAALPPG